MRRFFVVTLCWLLVWAAAAAALECKCAAARATGGWCLVHAVGYLGGVEVKSELLFEQMDAHGHRADLTTFLCPNCKKAIAEAGFCVEHRVGFVAGLTYFSRLTYELARGQVLSEAELKCKVCQRNAAAHGWCSSCKVGMAGHIAIRDPQAFQHVERELRMLELANAAAKRCEQCAVAIVIDGQCPLCRITYKDGQRVQ